MKDDHQSSNTHNIFTRVCIFRCIYIFWTQILRSDLMVQSSTIWKVFVTSGEEQEKAKRECLETMRTIEDEALGDHKKKFFLGGEEIGMVDIAFGWLSHWFEVIQEVIEVKLLEANEFPRLHSWIYNFKQVPLIKENLPPYEELLAHFKQLRKKLVT